MKIPVFLAAVFILATSFVIPGECGPAFTIINNSCSEFPSVQLYNSNSTYNRTFIHPHFPISIEEQSGTSWYLYCTTVLKTRRKPVEILIRNHHTQEKIKCYKPGPCENFSLSFSTGCDWVDVVFSDDNQI